MTDFATLAIKVDSSEAGKAATDLDKLTAAGGRVDVSAKQFSQALKAAGGDLSKVKLEATSAAQAAQKLATVQSGASARMNELTTSVGAQRAGMQQLGFQLQDFAVQVAGGTSATRAFAQQFPQAIGAVTLMAGSTSKLGAFMGGPWGVALAVAASALVPLIAKLWETDTALDEVAKSSKDTMAALRESVAASSAVSDAFTDQGKAYVTASARAAQLGAEIKRTEADARALSRTFGAGEAAVPLYQKLGRLEKERNAELKKAREAQNNLNTAMGIATTVIPMQTRNREILNATEEKATKAKHKLTDAERAAIKAAKEAARAYDDLVESAKSYAEQLEDQVVKFGKSALEIQRMEVAAKAAAAPTAELAKRIRDAGAALEEKQIKKATDDFNKMIVAIYDEVEALGLVGVEREYAALQLEKEGKLAEWLAQGLGDLERRWLEYAAARMSAIETKSAIERDLEAAERLNEQMDALLGSLGRMGGIGGLFGDIGSVLTSKNPIASMLGMGGVGTILGSLLDGGVTTEKMGLQFTESLHAVFGKKGELPSEFANKLGSTLAELTTGAAIGGAVGGTFFGGSQSAQTGAMVGGMLGKAAFKEFASEGLKKALGAFGGPLGSIVGSVLGGVIGGMISGTKRGGATIGAGGISGTWGNSSQRIGAATSMGNNAVDALSQLADALGVSLGSFSSSVSVRKNDLRFDPTGSGISKTGKGAISFGQDEEALMKAVIADAISDGAFQGLSEGFKKYLTSGDVESRLQDVLNLRGVMNEAAQLRDPQGYALSELDKWRTSMLAIATATGEGMADIEFVFGERRKEILSQFTTDTVQIEKDRKSLLIQIAELEGRSTEALAMAREMEKSAADASLGTLYDRIYALQDEAVAAQAAAQAAQALAAIQTEARSYFEQQTRLEADIMRLQGDEAGALKLERQLELYAMEEGLRALAIRKYALQDEAAVTAAATQALQAATNEREGLIRRLLTLAGDTAALRAKDLAALSPANRELQKMIWSVEDIASEAEKTVAANNTLIASYKSQADAAESLAARYDAFAADIRKYKMDLIAPAVPGAAGARFDKIAAMARLGDETALAGFTGAAGAYLENARNTAGSFAEYQRALIKVIGQSELAASGADGLSKAARAQIGAIAETTAALEAANVLAETEAQEAAKRFVEQIEALGDLDFIQTETLDAVNNQTDVLGEKLEAQAVTQGELLSAINALRFEMAARDEPATIALGRIESYLRTASRGDYLAVGGIDTDGLTVTTV